MRRVRSAVLGIGAGVVAAFAPGFAPGFVRGNGKCGGTQDSSRSKYQVGQARAFPARLADGFERLQDPSVLFQEIESDSSTLKLEAMLPETGDLESISQLLMESFIEVLEPWMLPASLGPVASAWNWLIMEWERQIIKTTLTVNYKRIMTQPSLRKPKGWQFEGESLGMLLVTDVGNGPEAVAFLELCSLPPDGRTPDDTLGMLLMVFGDSRSARPYLQNFCVAPKWRRRGLGRVLLKMAERVVRDVWREDRIYLHAGSNEAARNLYRSSRYQMTGLLQSPESLHMSKALEGVPVTERATDVLEASTV